MKIKDKIHELRQETEKWPEQAQAQVAENMIKSEQSLMKADQIERWVGNISKGFGNEYMFTF